MRFRHGQHVKLTVSSGRSVSGVLHLPDALMHGPGGPRWESRSTSGALGVHTLRMPDGSLFRSEGRLS